MSAHLRPRNKTRRFGTDSYIGYSMIGLNRLNATPPPEAQPLSKQSLLLDGLRRVEQHTPVWMLPRLVTTLNLHHHLTAARQRLCDSHRAMMKQAGLDDVADCEGSGISVKGDTTIYNNGSKLLPWLVAAALPVAGWFLNDWLDKEQTPPVIAAPGETQDWKLGVKVTDRP